MSLKEIKWKENDAGSFIATCGGIKVGFIKRSLTNRNIFYPTIFNDMFRFKRQEFNNLEEAKKELEVVFKEIAINFIEDEKQK
jgi:hypothetical protein